MARLAAANGPMRPVQCDGFVVYAGKSSQNSQEPAKRRPAPAARSSARAVKRRATGSINNRVALARPSATWSFAVHSAVFAAILMGLFGAYSLGRYAATSGPQAGLVYARPVDARPPPNPSSADPAAERPPLKAYLR